GGHVRPRPQLSAARGAQFFAANRGTCSRRSGPPCSAEPRREPDGPRFAIVLACADGSAFQSSAGRSLQSVGSRARRPPMSVRKRLEAGLAILVAGALAGCIVEERRSVNGYGNPNSAGTGGYGAGLPALSIPVCPSAAAPAGNVSIDTGSALT